MQKPVDLAVEENHPVIADTFAQEEIKPAQKRHSRAEATSFVFNLGAQPAIRENASKNKDSELDSIMTAAKTKAAEALNFDRKDGKPDLDDETKTFLEKQYCVAELIVAGNFDLAQSEFQLLWKQRFPKDKTLPKKFAFRLNIFQDAVNHVANYQNSTDLNEQAILKKAGDESYWVTLFGKIASLDQEKEMADCHFQLRGWCLIHNNLLALQQMKFRVLFHQRFLFREIEVVYYIQVQLLQKLPP